MSMDDREKLLLASLSIRRYLIKHEGICSDHIDAVFFSLFSWIDGVSDWVGESPALLSQMSQSSLKMLHDEYMERVGL